MNSLSISIITPAYNNAEEVRKLLDSANEQKADDPSLEAIVVDDCSADHSIKEVAGKYAFARYHRLEKNSGPAFARNFGAAMAKNGILLFLDSDVILNSGTISRIKAKFDSNPGIDICGGEYDIEPANPSLGTRFKSIMVRSWAPKGDSISVFITRIVAIRKVIFDEMGGFDVKLKTAAVEDYEFGRRLLAKGYKIHYDPAISARHHFPSFAKQVSLFFHRSFMWIYIFRNYGKFDNTCTTPAQGVTQTAGFLSVVSIAASLLNPAFIYTSALFLAVFMIGNMRFLALAVRHNGIAAAILYVPMLLVISVSIVLGSAYGVFYHYLAAGPKSHVKDTRACRTTGEGRRCG